MFKILVVDDENLVRKGIVMETDWARLDCMVVAEAQTGRRDWRPFTNTGRIL